MAFKAVIFDMDGTIIDSLGIWERTNKQVVELYGIKITKDIEKELVHQVVYGGHSFYDSCFLIKQIANIEGPVEEIAQKHRQLVHNEYQYRIKFMQGFEEFYTKIAARALAVALATNAENDLLALVNASFELSKFFGSHMYNASHVNNCHKPDPAVYLYAAEKLGLPPTSCVAIEDSVAGIKAAKSAGMYCIGLDVNSTGRLSKYADVEVSGYSAIDLDLFI